MDKIQTIIKLDIIEIDNEDSTYNRYTVGYYSSFEIAEQVMYTLFVLKDEILFLTEEIELDTILNNEDYYKDYITYRQYKWVGDEIKMIHETPYSFDGYRNDEDYQYKVGDIIRYLYSDNKIGISIVGGVPPRYDKKKSQFFDFIDDSYLVYDLGEGDTHDHIMTFKIIGLAEIEPHTFKAYRDKLKERMKIWEKNK